MKYDNLSKSELILKIEKLELELDKIKKSDKKLQVEQQNTDNKQFYEDIIEAVREGLWVTDEHDKIIFANKAMSEIAGVPVEKIQGSNLLIDFPEETNGEFITYYEKAKKEKQPIWYDISVHTPGGSDVRQNGWVIPRYKDDEFIGIICTIRDVTQQKAAEAALKTSEQRYRSLLDNVSASILYYDLNGRVMLLNKLAASNIGGKPEDFVGKSLFEIFGRESGTVYLDRIKKAAVTDDIQEFEDSLQLQGRPAWFYSRFNKFFDTNGKVVGVQIISHDITKLKLAELDLVDAKNTAERYLDMSGSIFVSLDADGNIVLINKKGIDLFEYNHIDDLIGKNWHETFIPQDKRTEKRAQFNKIIEGKIESEDNYENKILTKSGKLKTISWHDSFIRDNDGKLQYLLASGIDVTEIRESQERFDLAMKASKDGLFDWNLITNDIYFSPGWKKMLGYADDELLNDFSSWELNVDPEALERTRILHMAQISKKQEYSELEFRMKHKDGHWVDILSRFEAVFDENGKAVRVIGTHVDITDRKIVDNSLKKSLEEKEILLRELYHRTKNNMQVISSMLGLRAMSINNQEFTDIFKDIENKILSMALVHKKLYESGDLSHINLKEYLEELVEQLQQSLSIPSKTLDIKIRGADIQVIFDTAVPFGIVINEIVTNAIKHAFPNRSSGRIDIDLDENTESQIILEITDNGIGLPEHFDIKKDSGFGLHTVFQLVESQLGGKMTMKNGNGLHCRVIIKNDIYESRL